jgi:membrane associated rhomboid family serine protease
MIPIRDVIPSRTTPWITLLLIGVNAAVYIHAATRPEALAVDFVSRFGLIPAEFSWATATTSLFVHQNLVHVGSNLLSLWIVGENVEDRLGHVRYALFYLAAGYAAGLAEVWALPASTAPLIGASGAIAGLVGAYVVMFPRSRVLVLVPLVVVVDVIEIPALAFLGFWFALQVAGGVGRLASTPGIGGIPLWAYLGGFLFGLAVARFVPRARRLPADYWD